MVLYMSTDEWIKQMWYVCTMEYYSAAERNKIGSFVEMWTDLESVTWEHMGGTLPSRMDGLASGDVFQSDSRAPWASCFLTHYGYLKCMMSRGQEGKGDARAVQNLASGPPSPSRGCPSPSVTPQ